MAAEIASIPTRRKPQNGLLIQIRPVETVNGPLLQVSIFMAALRISAVYIVGIGSKLHVSIVQFATGSTYTRPFGLWPVLWPAIYTVIYGHGNDLLRVETAGENGIVKFHVSRSRQNGDMIHVSLSRCISNVYKSSRSLVRCLVEYRFTEVQAWLCPGDSRMT